MTSFYPARTRHSPGQSMAFDQEASIFKTRRPVLQRECREAEGPRAARSWIEASAGTTPYHELRAAPAGLPSLTAGKGRFEAHPTNWDLEAIPR